MRLRCRSVRRGRLERRRRKSGRGRNMRESALRWKRSKGRRWRRSARWRRGWKESAMSAEMRVVAGEEAVGGMIARLEGMKEEVALLQGEGRHREVVPLQDVEVLLHRDRVCSW